MVKYGMVIDLKKCIGCHTCTIACKVENGTGPGIFWNLVLDRESGAYPAVKRSFTPRPCMHCDNPPCVRACPSGASYKRADGLVLIDQSKCIGCRYCIVACPYGARYFNKARRGYYAQGLTPYEELLYPRHETGVAGKCDFCLHLIERGEEPACVRSCPMNARTFGDLGDANTEVSRLSREGRAYRLLEDKGTRPSVYYLPA
ncbi:MAG: 4Fe-4S dicluster domain-containing protein [Chloroflexi bacterium]|nr:4Fe-4S dicluster domain-containing protein [Chloroflexota bacterium]